MKEGAARLIILGVFATACSALAQSTNGGGRTEDDRTGNHELIEILSVGGATCTIMREGHVLGTVILQSRAPDGSYVLGDGIKIDLDESHADIQVTCSRQGYATRTVTATYGFQYMFAGDAYPDIARVRLDKETGAQ